jgi:hypothetical protein
VNVHNKIFVYMFVIYLDFTKETSLPHKKKFRIDYIKDLAPVIQPVLKLEAAKWLIEWHQGPRPSSAQEGNPASGRP